MIYDEDPFRRRPRKSTARQKNNGRSTSGWRKIRAMAFQARADGQNQPIGWLRKGCSSLALERWYDFPEFGSYLGNVGLKECPPRVIPCCSGLNRRRSAVRGEAEANGKEADIRYPSGVLRGLDRARGQFTLELAAYNLIGLPELLGAAP